MKKTNLEIQIEMTQDSIEYTKISVQSCIKDLKFYIERLKGDLDIIEEKLDIQMNPWNLKALEEIDQPLIHLKDALGELNHLVNYAHQLDKISKPNES